MKSRLSEWAATSEIIGAAAIVVSLVFVGLEIRSNTRATQAAMLQQTVGFDIEILLGQGRDPESARVFSGFMTAPDTLSEDDYLQGRLLASASLRHIENLFLQYQSGMLSDDGWAAREGMVRRAFDFPGFSEILDGPFGLLFSGQFVEYVQQVRSELSSVSDPASESD